jgi:predicted nucleotidyltransferase
MRFHDLSRHLLGAPARVAVLGVLLSSDGREWTARELARHAGVSHPQVLEALRLFEAEGLVRQRRFGRSSVWSVDEGHFLTERLRSLATLEGDALRELLSAIESSLRAAGASEAYLFGSVARGSEDPSSDIDVLALFGSQRKAAAFRQTASTLADQFQRRFGNELHVLAYGPESSRRRGPKALVRAARQEGIPLEVKD